MHILAAPLTAAYMLSTSKLPHPCGNSELSEELRQQRLSELAVHLSSMDEFVKKNGSNWLVFSTHFDWEGILGTDLLHLLRTRGVTFGSADHDYVSVQTQVAAYGAPVVVLPYKAMFANDNFAMNSLETQPARTRTLDALFLGNMRRGTANAKREENEGIYRDVLLKFADALASADPYLDPPPRLKIEEVYAIPSESALRRSRTLLPRPCARANPLVMSTSDNCTSNIASCAWAGPKRLVSQAERLELVINTSSAYQDSTFCFAPRGDTPTSRRLFDALGAGCIPIIMDTYENIAHNLPFSSTIDWPSIAIFMGGLNCTTQSVDATAAWLAGLLQFARGACGAAAIESMRARGRKAFVSSLSYASTGIVDALLVEIARLRSENEANATDAASTEVTDAVAPDAVVRASSLFPIPSLSKLPKKAHAAQSKNRSVPFSVQLLHVPKTGGTTLELWADDVGVEWGRKRTDWTESGLPSSHVYAPKKTNLAVAGAHYRPLAGCSIWHVPRAAFLALSGADPFVGAETVCALRDPVERMISQYLYRYDPLSWVGEDHSNDTFASLQQKGYLTWHAQERAEAKSTVHLAGLAGRGTLARKRKGEAPSTLQPQGESETQLVVSATVAAAAAPAAESCVHNKTRLMADEVCQPHMINKYIHRVLAPLVAQVDEQERTWPYTLGHLKGRMTSGRTTGIRPDSCTASVHLTDDDCHLLPQWMYVRGGVGSESAMCDHVMRSSSLAADLKNVMEGMVSRQRVGPESREIVSNMAKSLAQSGLPRLNTQESCNLGAESLDAYSIHLIRTVYKGDYKLLYKT